MKAELIGNPKGTFGEWSDPAAWADGTVPQNSNKLHVQLDVSSELVGLGSNAAPFDTGNIIGASAGLSLGVGAAFHGPSFLQAHDIRNMDNVNVQGGGVLDVRHNLVNVGSLTLIAIAGGATAEIGHGIGSTTIFIGTGDPDQAFASPKLILDKPPQGSLSNPVNISPPGFHGYTSADIELGGVTFDEADLIPPVPNSMKEQIQLKNHGALEYTLTQVTGAASVSFAGIDHATGNDILHVVSNTVG